MLGENPRNAGVEKIAAASTELEEPASKRNAFRGILDTNELLNYRGKNRPIKVHARSPRIRLFRELLEQPNRTLTPSVSPFVYSAG